MNRNCDKIIINNIIFRMIGVFTDSSKRGNLEEVPTGLINSKNVIIINAETNPSMVVVVCILFKVLINCILLIENNQ